MSAQHTPGPWWVVDDRREPITVWGDADAGDDGRVTASQVCELADGPDDCGLANARLIAAAPELLRLAKRWNALDGGAWHVERYARDKTDLLAATSTVIAKAESE